MGLRDTFLNMLGADIQTGEMKKSSNNLLRSSRDFLKYGNREQLLPTWSDIKMSDKDMYRGYSYAVIQKRGNKVASLARENLITSAKPEVLDEYQKKNETVYHPYLKVIQNSQKFTEKQFWKTISIYLDLAGRYYLGVVRKQINPIREGYNPITTDVVEFILLNPYEIRRVIDKDKNLAGYVERKSDGRYREWPVHQIIEMRELNPFDLDNGHWAMTDAAKEAVYTINQSGDYTRQSLNGNIDAPGIITTDLILSDEDFMNFKSRVQQHTKGEPLFGNGTGAIHWDSMQIDLDKAALLDINEINRTTLFAVSGTSKTSLGIEQSGTTRETARVQSEQFISDTAQPRLEDIVDFLNLDYKQHYPNEYKQTEYNIDIKSAVGRDYATEAQAVQLRQSQVELALSLIQSGYTQESAYQYAQGDIELDGLELEKGVDKPRNLGEGEQPEGGIDPNSPQNPQTPDGGGNSNEPTKDTKTKTEEKQEDETDPKAQEQNSLDLDLEPHSELVAHNHEEGAKCTCEGCDDEKIETYINQVNEDDGKILNEAYDNLLGDIRKIQAEAIQDSVEKLTINAFEESDILTEDDKKSLLKKLKNAIKRYWWVLMPMFGNSLMARRNQEFGENTMFVFTNELQGDVESNAMTVAEGHLATIIKDILGASNKAYTDITEKAAAELIIKAYKKDPAKFSEYFTEEPTETEVKKAIENTDILEHNRRIYEKANKLALEGYDRNSIVKAVKAEYEHLSTARATTIAHNETSRAFTHSQYQADTQFLKSINKLDVAYKQLYSRSGNPCKYCQALIDKGPIPFTQNFLDKGQEIVINENGKTSTFRADYEAIQAGVVHCNCQCAYKLVFKDEDGKISSIYNTLWDKGDDDSDTSYRGWLDSHSANEQKTLNGGPGSGNFGHLGRPGKVGGSAESGSASASALPNGFIVSEQELEKMILAEYGAYDTESQLTSVATALGIDGAPKQVDKEAYNEAIKNGGIETFRGVHDDEYGTAKEYVKEFTDGDYYAGEGAFGPGIYTTSTLTEADFYSGGEGGEVLKMAIPKDLKIVEYSKISGECFNFLSAKTKWCLNKKEEALKNGDEKAAKKYENLYEAYYNMGPTTYATLKGYDGVHANSNLHGVDVDIYIITNRSKLITQKGDPTIKWDEDNKRAN